MPQLPAIATRITPRQGNRRPYRTHFHGSFDDEWGLHRGISEWWYVTGVPHTDDGRTLSYQVTLLSLRMGALLRPKVLMLALTDVDAGVHHYTQVPSVVGSPLRVTDTRVSWGDRADIERGPQTMTVHARTTRFTLDLTLDQGKGAFWHCDDGVLQMGSRRADQTTLYYSYTNMPTTGTLTLDGEHLDVTGKSWFDKQGGTFTLSDTATHWEWFSLRFDDDEEAMLFSFPQSGYQDGTFIPSDGGSRRLVDYTVTTTAFTTAAGMKFSAGWDIDLPGIKDEHYTLTPLMDGQLNFAYFEELAAIRRRADGKQVGVCFVELLPGVLNDSIKPGNMLKRIDS